MNKVRIRAVIIDDEDAIRDLICEILEMRGYEIYASSDPLVCPVYLDCECPCPAEHVCAHIIITDINMTNMTGLEFIEHQKSSGCKVQNIAVIAVMWTNEALAHANRLCCHTFNKPFNIDGIEKWLNECEKKIDHNIKLTDVPMRVN